MERKLILYMASTVLHSVKRIWRCCSERHLVQSPTQKFRSYHHGPQVSFEATLAGQVDQLWTKGICSSHSCPLLGKVKTAGQCCFFPGLCAEIPSTPKSQLCFFMWPILLTKGPLQAYSSSDCKPWWRGVWPLWQLTPEKIGECPGRWMDSM